MWVWRLSKAFRRLPGVRSSIRSGAADTALAAHPACETESVDLRKQGAGLRSEDVLAARRRSSLRFDSGGRALVRGVGWPDVGRPP